MRSCWNKFKFYSFYNGKKLNIDKKLEKKILEKIFRQKKNNLKNLSTFDFRFEFSHENVSVLFKTAYFY